MHAGRVLLTSDLANGDTLKMPEGTWQVRVFAGASAATTLYSVSALTLAMPGGGYAVGDTATTASGVRAVIKSVTGPGYTLGTFSVINHGTGYAVGDTVTQGPNSFTVGSVGTDGSVTGLNIIPNNTVNNEGTPVTAGATTTSGAGTGLTLSVAYTPPGAVLTIAPSASSTRFVSDVAATGAATTTDGAGTGLTLDITTSSSAASTGVHVITPGDTGPGALCGTYRPEFFQMQQGETLQVVGGSANVAVMTR